MSHPSSPTTGPRILVIDDEPDLRFILSEQLRRLGYQADVADDGAAALELLEESERSYDLIISDRLMPRLDGPELVRILRQERGYRGKICMVSGALDLHEETRTGLIDAVLAKPFRREQLVAMLADVLPGNTER